MFNRFLANNGPSTTTTQIIIKDQLPAQLTYVASDGYFWACGAVGQTLTCTNDQPLTVGSSTSVVISTSVKAGATGTIKNVATVSGGNTDQVATATDDAVINVPEKLAHTGASILGTLILGLVFIGLGLSLRLRRRSIG